MAAIDGLLTLAEIAVAFAGFSSIVVVFGRRDADGLQGFDRIRFRIMLQYSLLAAFFAVLPLPLHHLGVSAKVIWSLCSTGLGIYLGLGGVGQFLIGRAFKGARKRAVWVVFQLAYWSSFILQVLNVADVGLHREAGPYVVGLSWVLFMAGWQFYQLVSPANWTTD